MPEPPLIRIPERLTQADVDAAQAATRQALTELGELIKDGQVRRLYQTFTNYRLNARVCLDVWRPHLTSSAAKAHPTFRRYLEDGVKLFEAIIAVEDTKARLHAYLEAFETGVPS